MSLAWGCYATARQPFLLGSLSGFDQVPLLQALEAVLEDAALWLRRRDITTGEGGAGETPTMSHSAPNSHPNYPISFTPKRII